MNPVHEDHVDEDVRGHGHVVEGPIESSPLIRRLGDGLLAILVALVAWGGYYVQSLALDIRTLGVNVVILQQKMEKISELDKNVRDRIYESVLASQRIVDLERRLGVIDRALDEHVKSFAHQGTARDLALIQQRISTIEQRIKINAQER